ncbi:MAG: tRNA (N6-threonylcarbamoyladenosine(37)-N6)-methyltransferase TrmO [Dehalococcoidales bacterium]
MDVEKDTAAPECIQLKPIGFVSNQIQKPVHSKGMQTLSWQERVKKMREQKETVSEIEVLPEYADMLSGTEEFSHLMILYWAHLIPQEEQMGTRVFPFGNQEDFPEVGIFATHSPKRPNGILVTPVRLLERNGNILKVTGLDAVNGSPVLDIKSFVPENSGDEIRTPEWHKKMKELIK